MSLEQVYDEQTTAIMRRALGRDGTLVDIGCHEGKFTDQALQIAPAGRHYGFEPLPDYATRLRQRYADRPNVAIFDVALSDTEGEATFVYNRDIPSHSGLRERTYPVANSRRDTIVVRTCRLDDVLPPGPVAMIKIDVEGAELLVLRGATRILREQQPAVVFEFGIGAADHYGTGPRDIYTVFAEVGMGVFTLDAMLDGRPPLSLPEFEEQYTTPKNYYFGAQALSAPKVPFLRRLRRSLLGGA